MNVLGLIEVSGGAHETTRRLRLECSHRRSGTSSCQRGTRLPAWGRCPTIPPVSYPHHSRLPTVAPCVRVSFSRRVLSVVSPTYALAARGNGLAAARRRCRWGETCGDAADTMFCLLNGGEWRGTIGGGGDRLLSLIELLSQVFQRLTGRSRRT